MTLAHELQHFVQHACEPELWAESSVVTNLTPENTRALNLTRSDIPIGREA
jgi:Zn-dependent peptidase ImmA (M78 family)